MATQFFRPTNPYGTLTINSISLMTYAWLVIDPRPLWMPQAYRGSNVVTPAAAGKRAYPYRVDEANHSLPMYITGDVTSTGVVNSSRYAGLEVNIGILNGLLVPPTAPTGTYTASLTIPSGGGPLGAEVQVLGLDLGAPDPSSPHVLRAMLHLRIPAGKFA